MGEALRQQNLVLIGQRSLDIYAIHFMVIGIWPPIVGTLASSLGISAALRLSPLTRVVFFGDRERPVRSINGDAVSAIGAGA